MLRSGHVRLFVRAAMVLSFVISGCSSDSPTEASDGGGSTEPKLTQDAGTATNNGSMPVDAGGNSRNTGADASVLAVAVAVAVAAGAGAASLGGRDGITAKIGDKTYTYTTNTLHVPQTTPTVLISAADVVMGLPDSNFEA